MTSAYSVESYLEGQLTSDQETAFEKHLKKCGCCQKELADRSAPDEFEHQLELVRTPADKSTVEFSYLTALARKPPCFQPDLPRVPRQLGKYEVQHKLGSGGYGVVYQAYDTDTHATLAIKVLRPRKSHDGIERHVLLEEARRSCAVNHPHVVRLLAVEEVDDLHFVVMDLVEGETLQQRLQCEVTLEPREAATVVSQVASALAAVHAAEVLHGDTKPGNIIIESSTGHAKIADFGLSQEVERDAGSTRRHVAGTPPYMSPEQISGNNVDCRTDLFSLGVVLYELLTGTRPFPGDREQLKKRIPHEEPLRPRKLKRDVPKDLESITLKCLEKNPAKRYQTATELQQELHRWLNDEPIEARPTGRLRRSRLFVKRNRIWLSICALLVSIATLSVGSAAIVLESNFSVRRAYDVADSNALATRAVLSKYLTSVTQYRLANAPGIQTLREELICLVLPYYQQFLAQSRDDVSLRADIADVQFRLAHLFLMTGEVQEAKRYYGEAKQFFAELQDHGPKNRKDRVLLAMFLTDHAHFAEQLSLAVDGEGSYKAAIQLARTLVADEPANRDHAEMLAQALTSYGAWLVKHKRLQDSQQASEEAIAILEQLLGEPYARDVHRHGLATAYFNLAEAEFLKPEPSADITDSDFAKAIDIWQTLLAEDPNALHYQDGIGRAMHSRGALHQRQGDLTEARRCLQASQAMFQALTDQNPQVAGFSLRRAKSSFRLAQVAYQRQNWGETLNEVQNGLDALQRVQEYDVDQLDLRPLLAEAYKMRVNILSHYDDGSLGAARNRYLQAATDLEMLIQFVPESELADLRLRRAVYLAWADDHERAAPLAEELVSLFSGHGKPLFDLACVFSRCGKAAEADKLADDRAKRYATVALELLAKPATLAFLRERDDNLLDEDSDLQWLRDAYPQEFQLLRERLAGE